MQGNQQYDPTLYKRWESSAPAGPAAQQLSNLQAAAAK